MEKFSLQQQYRSEILTSVDWKIFEDIITVIESPTFDLNGFLFIVQILSEYLLTEEFLGLDKIELNSLKTLHNYNKDEEGQYLRELSSCQRAAELTDFVFDHPKVNKYWRITHAAKIQSVIGEFCKQLHETPIALAENIEDYVQSANSLIYQSLRKISEFNVQDNNLSIRIDGDFLERLGLFIMLRFHRVLILNNTLRRETYNVKGIETFRIELSMVIRASLAKRNDIKKDIDKSFRNKGVLYRTMRVGLTNIPEELVEDNTENIRTVEETLHILNTKQYDKGLCPAAFTMEYEGETLSLAHIYARIILAAIPSYLLLNK